MSAPVISLDSPLAADLSRTLGITKEKLADLDGQEDGKIDLFGLQKNSRLKKRIASSPTGEGEDLFLVDNGDGVISHGDLLLHRHPLYRERGEAVWRNVQLFGRTPEWERSVPPPVLAQRALEAKALIERRKDKTFSTALQTVHRQYEARKSSCQSPGIMNRKERSVSRGVTTLSGDLAAHIREASGDFLPADGWIGRSFYLSDAGDLVFQFDYGRSIIVSTHDDPSSHSTRYFVDQPTLNKIMVAICEEQMARDTRR